MNRMKRTRKLPSKLRRSSFVLDEAPEKNRNKQPRLDPRDDHWQSPQEDSSRQLNIDDTSSYEEDVHRSPVHSEESRQEELCERKLLAATKNSMQNKPSATVTEIKKRLEALEGRQVSIQSYLKKIMELLESIINNNQLQCTAEAVPNNYIINGRNVMMILTRDGYSFGLELLDMLFTPKELSQSLVYLSKKSSKPALNKEKVDRLMGLVTERFPQVDMKMLLAKLNQKCWDKLKKNTEDDDSLDDPPPHQAPKLTIYHPC